MLFCPLHWAVSAGVLLCGALAAPQPYSRDTGNTNRAEAVKEAYLHSWNGYSKYAFGHDELLSVSNKPSDSRNGWGATIADAITTGILMELDDVVATQLDFLVKQDFTVPHTSSSVSLFETTIRYLGGMIAAYDLLKGPYSFLLSSDDSSDKIDALLEQAKTLANGLSFAFDTPSGVPFNNLDYGTRSSADRTNGIATIGTLVLEWTRLADLTGNKTYADLSQKGESYLLNPQPSLGEPFPGLLGTDVNITSGQFLNSAGGWGGGDDSFYEYLIKAFVYDPDRFSHYKDRWVLAADSTISKLVSHPEPRPDITFVDSYNSATSLVESMGHLNCFIGGNFLLGATVLGEQKYKDAGLAMTSGCHDTYTATATRIGPEGFMWNTNGVPSDQASFFKKNGFYITVSDYDLRPEVVESYYYSYKLTGDSKYQDWAWDAFLAINSTCRTDSGFTSIDDVNTPGGGAKGDFQESFWFAEVMKYFYIIFAEDVEVGFQSGAQDWVFNTEAHPLKVFSGGVDGDDKKKAQ